jgi:hypothetical protein
LSDKKNLDREKSAPKIYEKKVKESAKELTSKPIFLSTTFLELNKNKKKSRFAVQLDRHEPDTG